MLLNDFKNQLIKVINESNLSVDAIYYVMKDIMNDIVIQYNTVLQQEAGAAASINEEAPSAENIEKED